MCSNSNTASNSKRQSTNCITVYRPGAVCLSEAGTWVFWIALHIKGLFCWLHVCSFYLVLCYRVVGSPLAVRPREDLSDKVLSTGRLFVQLFIAQTCVGFFFLVVWGWPGISKALRMELLSPLFPRVHQSRVLSPDLVYLSPVGFHLPLL